MKKYDNYKDSGIEWLGEIPEHWKVKKLKFFANVVLGKMLTNEDKGDYSLRKYLRAKNIEWHKPNVGDVKEMWFSSKELITFRIKKDDLLVSEGGEVGRTCRWDNELEECYIQNSVHKVTIEQYGSSNYFLNQFKMFGDRGHFDAIVNKISIAHLTKEKLSDISFIFPPVEEQSAIANYLDHKTTQIVTLIAKKQQFISLLQEERTAVINQAVTKGLDPKAKMKDSGIEWLGEIPEHWEVKKLKLVFNPSKGLTITKENLTDEGIQCVNYGEVHSKFGFELDTNINKLKCVDFSYLESNDRSLIECGDFVFADTSEDIAGAGNFTYLKSKDKIFAGYHTIILKPIENLDSRFFAYEFDSIPFRTQIRQSVKGVKVFSITQAILKNVSTWFPPKSEQKSISDFLTIETEKIDSIISKAKEEIELLKEYKTALISEVVTGKVDVREIILN